MASPPWPRPHDEIQPISQSDSVRLIDGAPKCDVVDSAEVMYARSPDGHLLYLPNDGPPETVQPPGTD